MVSTAIVTDFNDEGFEGPEKKLELLYISGPQDSSSLGLRNLNAKDWQNVLDFAKCTIISQKSNEHFDSYVLSESSLFVYPKKVLLKTCGTTTLLNTVPSLLEVGKPHGLEVSQVFYSHKNYNFPSRQILPHGDFQKEIEYLRQHFAGTSHTLGDPVGDHWNLFFGTRTDPVFVLEKEEPVTRSSPPEASGAASRSRSPSPTRGVGSVDVEANLEIMMSELDEATMKQFYRSDDFISSKHVTESTGIDALLPGSVIDEFQFEPCGYSMNGLLNSSYSTIHITPEPHCSFVSYETNHELTNYTQLVKRVITTFKPGKFSLTLKHHADLSQTFGPEELNRYTLLHTETVKNDSSVLWLYYNFVKSE